LRLALAIGLLTALHDNGVCDVLSGVDDRRVTWGLQRLWAENEW
jgi:hypothetical protein